MTSYEEIQKKLPITRNQIDSYAAMLKKCLPEQPVTVTTNADGHVTFLLHLKTRQELQHARRHLPASVHGIPIAFTSKNRPHYELHSERLVCGEDLFGLGDIRDWGDVRTLIDVQGQMWRGPVSRDNTMHWARWEGMTKPESGEIKPIWVLRQTDPPEPLVIFTQKQVERLEETWRQYAHQTSTNTSVELPSNDAAD